MADTHIHGTNRIQAILVGRDDVPVAQIGTCLGVEYTAVLNDAGTWSARFPANDPKLVHLELKRHFLHVYVDGEILCYGLTETWNWELSNDGQRILVLGGRDSLAELDETSMATWTDEDFDGNNLPFNLIDDYNEINGYDRFTDDRAWSLAKWDYDTEPYDDLFPITDMVVYGEAVGESALRILIRVAEYTGESFRLAQSGTFPDVDFQPVLPKRHVEWLGNEIVSSGVRAVGTVGEPADAEGNAFVCFIQGLTERRDTSRMLTTIYPHGTGFGETRLDLAGISAAAEARIAAAGMTYNAAANAITSTAAETYLGKAISRQIQFKDIRPLFNTDADIQTAKDYLADAAVAYVARNDDIDDTLEYDLSVLQLPSHVKVGMTLHVLWQEETRTIDDSFYILAIRTVVGSNGERTYTLTIATANQWRLKESSNIVAQMEEGQILGAHPQIDASAYWMPFKEEVGDNQTDHMAEFPFWLSAEIVTIRQVLFRFKVAQIFGVFTETVYATPDTGASGTGSTSSNSPGTSDADGTAATGANSPGTSDASGTDATGATAAGTTDSGSGSLTGNTIISGDTDTDGAGNTGIQSALGDPHTHDRGAHTHHFSTTEHQHTETAHTHGHTATHTHSGPSHTHAHSAMHTHTGPSHTHAHSATHAHTGPSHTHTAPALQSTYSGRLLDALNTYAIGDLEYAVNGGAWVALNTAIPVAGGYSEVDITSDVQNPNGLKRPYQEANLIQIRRTTAAGTGKTAMIRAQVGIRCTIQSIVLYE